MSAMICGKICYAPEGDYFAVCSFDKNHVVLRSRMPYHIVKCLKQHPGHNKIQCPYDATEYLDPDSYPEHIMKCEAAQSVGISNERYELARLKATGNLCNSEREPPPYHHKSAPQATEDWGGKADEVEEVETPRGVGRGVSLRKSFNGMGRAERLLRAMKQFEERKALNRSNSSTISSCSTSSPGQFDDD